MKNKSSISPLTKWRFFAVIFFILMLVLLLIARMVDLTIFKHYFLLKQGNVRSVRTENTPAFRGMILDRNGYPLAISASVFSVWVNPSEILPEQSLASLSKLLIIDAQKLEKMRTSTRKFIYLKRGISPNLAGQIKSLKIPGIYLQQEYKRYYPEGEVTAHIVGMTNIDDKGQEGLELLYQDWLSGNAGKKIVLKDRRGREIADVKLLKAQKAGNNLVLSINKNIQYLAYRELAAGVQEFQAVSGSVVVLDTVTGEILAMVNQPSFNPNNPGKHNSDTYRNRAVTDVFEPGSTIKAFSVASGIDSGKYHRDSVIDSPGWLRVGRNIVRDEHSKGLMTISEIMQISSDVGVTKIVLSLPPDTLWKVLSEVGFGEVTGVNFPGERAGSLIKRNPWKPFALATLSFGYGMSVTPLQLAQAYSVIANGGVKKPISLLRVNKIPQGEQVMNPNTAKETLALLEDVISGPRGTGKKARVPGYRVAGKTGTARIAAPHGYYKNRYESSFVGIVPASHPRLVVAVLIHDPRGKKYYGADVSAPICKNIMEGALRILNVSPDQPISI